MSELNRLQNDPVFLGLTRPPMFLGVTYSWAMMELFGMVLYFIVKTDFADIAVCAIILHGTGYYVSSKDPNFVPVMKAWLETYSKCRNRVLHSGTSSFDIFK